MPNILHIVYFARMDSTHEIERKHGCALEELMASLKGPEEKRVTGQLHLDIPK